MIYLVTGNQSLFSSEDTEYTVISVEESLELLAPLSTIGVDTETEGIDVHTKKLLLAQFGCFDFQVVVDCRTIDITLYKELLEDQNKLFLFWNAKFDLKFFLKYNIVIKNIYDGYLAEKLLWLGYPDGIHSMSLKSAGFNYCNIDLDKSVRGKIIWSKTLTSDIIIYGAQDVKYLEQIREKQLIELRKKDLIVALAYENKFCPVLAYTEFCGAKLDEEKWKAKMEKDKIRFKKALDDLNSWVVHYCSEKYPGNENSPYTYVELQGDLFSGWDTEPKCIINWSSPKQVIPFLEELGFKLETFDKKTKEKKKSVGADIIEAQKDVSPIATFYLEYKACEKLIGTYGQNVLDQINPITHRIHTNFNQLGCDTGRLSSGGKDKENKIEYLNFQNFPRDAETRSCFVSEKGYKWISCDYSAQESRVIADVANDKAMLDLFNVGCGDMHSLVAKMSYPDIIGDCPIEEIKDRFKKYRQEAKGVEFAINYGGDANTIKSNKNIPLEEAQKIYDDYMNGFPGVKSYQFKQRKFVMENGYILLNPKTRHKAFIYDYQNLCEIRNQFNGEFWETYKEFKQTRPDSTLVEQVKHYFRRKSASEKQAINYPIQGTSAVMFKLASIFLYDYIIKHNLLFKVKLCIPAHDEWNIEVPDEYVETMTKVLQNCMERAGKYFCPKLDFPAEAEVSTHWIH